MYIHIYAHICSFTYFDFYWYVNIYMYSCKDDSCNVPSYVYEHGCCGVCMSYAYFYLNMLIFVFSCLQISKHRANDVPGNT